MRHSWLRNIDFEKLLRQEIKAPYFPKIDEIDYVEEEDRRKF
jgi:hypothetical protein